MSLNTALKSIGKFILNVLTTPSDGIYPIKRLTNDDRTKIYYAKEDRIFNPDYLTKNDLPSDLTARIGLDKNMMAPSFNYKTAKLSSKEYIGLQLDNGKIQGTATGPFANFVLLKGDAKYGSLRYKTAVDGYVNFSRIWSDPSFNNYGTAGTDMIQWDYRPEYSDGSERQSKYDGAYHFFKDDRNKNLEAYGTANSSNLFYNDTATFAGNIPSTLIPVSAFHKYYPNSIDPNKKDSYYASPDAIKNQTIGASIQNSTSQTNTIQSQAVGVDANSGATIMSPFFVGAGGKTNIISIYKRMFRSPKPGNETANSTGQFRASAERYTTNLDIGVNNYNNYAAIYPENSKAAVVEKSTVLSGPFLDYLKENGGVVDEIKIDNRSFAKANTDINEIGEQDEYNSLLPTKNKRDMYLNDSDQSRDLIFFYFYDLVNEIYIPFRATISSITDNNTADWETVKYMGRADSLYVYKGFSRDATFTFKVYANSIRELVPMWKRINYLVGLTRPSGYTGKATVTNNNFTNSSNSEGTTSPPVIGDDSRSIGEVTIFTNTDKDISTTGAESGFIVPPMIRFRIGDLYDDQPAILRNVAISIPDDATWETLRDDTYKYFFGTNKTKELTIDATSKQLPNIIDVTVQLALIERKQSITNENHFGPKERDNDWEMKMGSGDFVAS
jgi:hypothetical protein